MGVGIDRCYAVISFQLTFTPIFPSSSLHRHGIDISIAVGVMVGGWREIVCLEGELKRKKKCAALHLILYPHAGSV